MKTDLTSPTGRRRVAEAALHDLGAHRSDHQRLSMQCPRSHHLAFVYDTPAGLVYTAPTGPHSHGSKDRIDVPHHGAAGHAEHTDLLEGTATSDDALPAWCDCGPRTLSRAEIRGWVRDGLRTARVP